jgi:deazaflavin-dependent oxidoreductase (nitroreductase family)
MTNAELGRLADHEPSVRTPPRFAIRIFWIAQRAIYRLSNGHIGLSRPEVGNQFGMLRLETVGRRTGKRRAAIVGYFEDGPNLVTLAMNGWGEDEPAWWLNLEANPEATVDLVDGPRAVLARGATGDERERLWAKVGGYPGWGADIDGLAARRPGPTAVVVFEPREAVAETDTFRGDASDRPASTAQRGAASAGDERVIGRGRRIRLRHLWLVPGIGLALFANAQASRLGVGIVPLLMFGIVPDVPRLFGLRRPTMRMLHTAMHLPPVALVVLIGAALTGMSPFVYVGALAWLGHIVVGWGTGDRVRSAEVVVGKNLPGQFRPSAPQLAVSAGRPRRSGPG